AMSVHPRCGYGRIRPTDDAATRYVCRRRSSIGRSSPNRAERLVTTRRGVGIASRVTIAQVHHAVAEAPLVEQIQLDVDAVRQRPLAAAHHDGREEQLHLVDEPGRERLAGELWTA